MKNLTHTPINSLIRKFPEIVIFLIYFLLSPIIFWLSLQLVNMLIQAKLGSSSLLLLQIHNVSSEGHSSIFSAFTT